MKYGELCHCCSCVLYRTLDDNLEIHYGVFVRDARGNEYNLCRGCLDTLLFESAMIDNGSSSSLDSILCSLPATRV
jgi:hypothetical protein